jgi:hypothetical protein
MPGRSLLLAVLLLAACRKPTRWDQATEAPLPPRPTEPARVEKAGGLFNRAFPADGTDGYKRVFTQEKEGFAEAKLQRDGKDVATLAITDVGNDGAARGKFDRASDKLASYPLVTVGKNQSAVLVNNRFQVKVSSPTLGPDARKQLLSRFDLAAVAAL